MVVDPNSCYIQLYYLHNLDGKSAPKQNTGLVKLKRSDKKKTVGLILSKKPHVSDQGEIIGVS